MKGDLAHEICGLADKFNFVCLPGSMNLVGKVTNLVGKVINVVGNVMGGIDIRVQSLRIRAYRLDGKTVY